VRVAVRVAVRDGVRVGVDVKVEVWVEVGIKVVGLSTASICMRPFMPTNASCVPFPFQETEFVY